MFTLKFDSLNQLLSFDNTYTCRAQRASVPIVLALFFLFPEHMFYASFQSIQCLLRFFTCPIFLVTPCRVAVSCLLFPRPRPCQVARSFSPSLRTPRSAGPHHTHARRRPLSHHQTSRPRHTPPVVSVGKGIAGSRVCLEFLYQIFRDGFQQNQPVLVV